MDGLISLGELLSFYALMSYFNAPINSIITMNRSIQAALIASDRLFEILDLKTDSQNGQILLSKDDLGDIEIRNLSFRHGMRSSVFENLSLGILN